MTVKNIDEFDPFDVRGQEGMTVWDLAYEWIGYEVARCIAAGRGVGMVIHTDKEFVTVGRETIEVHGPITTVRQMRRLFPVADGAILIDRHVGKKSTGKGMAKRTKVVIRQYLVSRHPDLNDHLKSRTPVPLPERWEITDGWESFAEMWNRKPQLESSE